MFELPQREIGGRLPAWADLHEQGSIVRESGAAVHLDGARLWECTPYYQRSPSEIASLFDTVYVSFLQGTRCARRLVPCGRGRRHRRSAPLAPALRSTLFGLWPNAASALAGLRKRLPQMPAYFERSRAIADEPRSVSNVEIVPDPPETPMMHLHLRVDERAFEANALRVAQDQGLFTWPGSMPTATPSIRRVELTVGDASLRLTPEEVSQIVQDLIK